LKRQNDGTRQYEHRLRFRNRIICLSKIVEAETFFFLGDNGKNKVQIFKEEEKGEKRKEEDSPLHRSSNTPFAEYSVLDISHFEYSCLLSDNVIRIHSRLSSINYFKQWIYEQ
jgi:hypothetical protein